ncbi:mCG146341, partial [Mus musculus]
YIVIRIEAGYWNKNRHVNRLHLWRLQDMLEAMAHATTCHRREDEQRALQHHCKCAMPLGFMVFVCFVFRF